MSYSFPFSFETFYNDDTSKKLSILIFSWNTQSIRISNMSSFIMYNKPNDFFPFMLSKILEYSPNIVVFGFQEDVSPGSHFHSHLLKEELPKNGYVFLKRNKCVGIGKTTYDSALEGGIKFRGLRMSIYVREDCIHLIKNDALEKDIAYRVGNDGQKTYISNIMCNKGALISYISYTGFRVIAIICAHLPFNSQSIIDSKLKNNPMLRQNELNHSNIVFNNILDCALQEKCVKNIIYFGDFNYRLHGKNLNASDVASDICNDNFEYYYTTYDELHGQMKKENIYKLKEGVENKGPNFFPTAKMIKNRSEYNINIPLKRWKLGKYDQRVPSWTDRILYNSTEENINCIEYNSYDEGETMKLSDHQGVYGLITIEN